MFFGFNDFSEISLSIFELLIKFFPIFFQERALQYIDNTEGDVEVAEGIRLVQTGEPIQGRSMNDVHLSDDEEQRDTEVNALLVDRVARFLGSHTLQFKVPDSSIKDIQRSFDEGMIFD